MAFNGELSETNPPDWGAAPAAPLKRQRTTIEEIALTREALNSQFQLERQYFNSQFQLEIKQLSADVCVTVIDALTNPTVIEGLAKTLETHLAQFPEDQREEQISTPLTLAKAVQKYMKKPRVNSLGFVNPGLALTYGAWKKCRKLIGRRSKKVRVLNPAAFPQPLRWAEDKAGKPTYIFTDKEAKRCVRELMGQLVKEKGGRPEEPVFHRIRYFISSEQPETWPETML